MKHLRARDADLLTRALELAMSSAQASRPWFEERPSSGKSQEQRPAGVSASGTTRCDLRAVAGSALYSQSRAECPLWSYLDRDRWHDPSSRSAVCDESGAKLTPSE